MNKLKIFLILTGYQATWLACVFGSTEKYFHFFGLYMGIFFIFIYFFMHKQKIKLLKIILLISVPGYFFDSSMVYLNIYQFNNYYNFGLLPIWMLVLWPSFSILFDKVFVFFKNYKLIGILSSGILGPITYYVGSPIDLITINNLSLFIILMFIFWILLFIYYLEFILK